MEFPKIRHKAGKQLNKLSYDIYNKFSVKTLFGFAKF
jgi:hypothetical protein